jgi:hypothetical protein
LFARIRAVNKAAQTSKDGIHALDAKDFYLKEYESLRAEILWLLQDCRTLERNVIVAIGVSWAWLFEKKDALPGWAWLIPCLFAVLGGIRMAGIMQSFSVYREYMTRIEKTFSGEGDPGGWDTSRHRIHTSDVALVFWILLILATIVVAYMEGRGRPDSFFSHGRPW